ncbi:Telomerase reverse transcriptase, variant 3 [Balamuthia mandrillaris]
MSPRTRPHAQRPLFFPNGEVNVQVLQQVFSVAEDEAATDGKPHNNLQTLHRYLLHAMKAPSFTSSSTSATAATVNTSAFSSNRKHKKWALLRADDPPAYRALLTGCLVGTLAEAPPAAAIVTDTNQRFTQAQLLNQVLETLFLGRSGAPPNHLLAKGYRKQRPGQGHGMQSLYGVECYFPNTLVNVLKGSEWDLLLSRIGDACMLHLLLHTCLFLPLPNSCYMQLTGPPLSSLLLRSGRKLKRPPSKHQSASTAATSPARTNTKAKEENHPTEWRVERPKDPSSTTAARLERSRIFYSNPFKGRGLPKLHVLNNVKASNKGVHILLTNIFLQEKNSAKSPEEARSSLASSSGGVKVNVAKAQHSGSKKHQQRVPARLVAVTPLLKRMIQRHNKVQNSYHRALNRHCPLPLPRHLLPTESPASLIPSSSRSAKAIALVCLDADPSTQRQPEREGAMDADPSTPVSIKERKRALNRVTNYNDLFQYHSACKYVTAFVKAVCSYLIPFEMWGSQHNLSIFHQNIYRFVKSRRFESLTIEQIMQGMKLNDCKWLDCSSRKKNKANKDKHKGHLPPNDAIKRHKLMKRWLRWVFEGLIVPLLRNNFYVTEKATTGKRIYYYRKPIWARVSTLAMQELLSRRIFEEISDKETQRLLSRRPFGYSFLRFLAKQQGIRPIMNLAWKPSFSPSACGFGKSISPPAHSINTILSTTFHVLNSAKDELPQSFGGSVFSYNEAYVRIAGFLQSVRRSYAQSGGGMESTPSTRPLPALYMVSVDVKQSFDNVNHHKLWSAVMQLLNGQRRDQYLVQRYATHVPIAAQQRIHSTYERAISHPAQFPQFLQFATQRAATLKNAVLTDEVVYALVDKSEIKKLLKEHIFSNIVCLDGRFYRQRKGIPQGSVLSSLLCSLLYGYMENNCLEHLPKEDYSLETGNDPLENKRDPAKGVLVRLIDDFLYITTCKEKAERFVADMQEGYPAYGCMINTHKTRVNFATDLLPKQCCFLPDDKTGTAPFLPWCGLLINTVTLEIMADYSRYYGCEIENTLTVKYTGEAFRQQMLLSIRPKCHPLLLDGNVNSVFTVRLNVYQAFLFSAIKYHCHICCLPFAVDERNASFFNGVIGDVLEYMNVLIKLRCTSPVAQRMACSCPITRHEVYWLGYKAYLHVMQRKHARYAPIVAHLKEKLGSLPKSKQLARRLRLVVQPHRSPAFANMLY